MDTQKLAAWFRGHQSVVSAVDTILHPVPVDIFLNLKDNAYEVQVQIITDGKTLVNYSKLQMAIFKRDMLPENGAVFENPPINILVSHAINFGRVYTYKIVNGIAQIMPVHLEWQPDRTRVVQEYHQPISYDYELFCFENKTAHVFSSLARRKSYELLRFDDENWWKRQTRQDAKIKAEQAQIAYDCMIAEKAAFEARERAFEEELKRRAEQEFRRMYSSGYMSLPRAYQILGVPQTANKKEIKLAFRKLAKQHHPDLGGDTEQFKILNAAYQLLEQSR